MSTPCLLIRPAQGAPRSAPPQPIQHAKIPAPDQPEIVALPTVIEATGAVDGDPLPGGS